MKTPYRRLIHSVGWALCLNLTSLTATIASAKTDRPHPLTVAAPAAATSFTGTVPIQLEMSPSVVTHSLRVGLNGRPIDPKRLAMATGCSETANQRANPILPPGPKGDCMTGTLTAADGLKPGRNTLKVSAVNQDGSLDAESVDFGYTPPETQLGAADSGAYMPKSIGLTVSRGGTLPWVQITTGWPQPASPDPFSHPYYDQTFPTSNDTACAATDIYQVLVLDRTTPTNEIAYKCFDNDAKLTAYLGTLTASDLVIEIGRAHV